MTNVSAKLGLLPVRPWAHRFFSEIDYYGLSHTVTEEARCKLLRVYDVAFQHGWNHQELKIITQVYTYHEVNARICFVASKRVGDFLTKVGASNHVVSGMPLVYSSPQYDCPRIKHSLIIYLPHSRLTTRMSADADEFIRQYVALKDKFSLICFSVYGDDCEKGLFVNEIKRYGFHYVVGSSVKDVNSLNRMRQIFTMFDHMHTNVLGSHVLYAAFFGCKTSLSPDIYLKDPNNIISKCESLKPDTAAKLYLSTLESQPELVRSRYGFLMTESPLEARTHIDWARSEIGVDHKLDNDEMIDLVGWKRNIKQRLLKPRALRRVILKTYPQAADFEKARRQKSGA